MPASHTPSIHAALLFSYFCYFSCLPKSCFKEPWFPRRLLMVINARKHEHLAIRCVGGLQTLPRPWKRSSSPMEGCPCPWGPGDSLGRPPGAPAAPALCWTWPAPRLQGLTHPPGPQALTQTRRTFRLPLPTQAGPCLGPPPALPWLLITAAHRLAQLPLDAPSCPSGAASWCGGGALPPAP